MSRKPGRLALLVAAILGGLLSPVSSAHALTVDWAPAGWTDYYAGSSTAKSITTKPVPYVSHPKYATAQSTFIINYTNVPENEKVAIQAAVDSWAAN